MKQDRRIIECVPNFSEGRDRQTIDAITREIERSPGVKLLDVDPGEATNRTVVTFVGNPDDVCEAAFRAVAKAGELIDMRHHHGAHPRMGATDVLPLIPVAGISLEECAALARRLAERIATELRIPTYCYEAAAGRAERKNCSGYRRSLELFTPVDRRWYSAEYKGVRSRWSAYAGSMSERFSGR